jgi:hypothetical protein
MVDRQLRERRHRIDAPAVPHHRTRRRAPMTHAEPTPHAILKSDDASAMPWQEARERLAEPPTHRTFWLTTINPDGRPHMVPIGALWIDGGLYFTMGQGTKKGANLSRDSRCAIAAAGRGLDFVIEGTAKRLTDPTDLQRVADAYTADGWPLSYRDGVLDAPYNAPTTGPSPIEAYELQPTTARGFGTEEATWSRPTRWRF